VSGDRAGGPGTNRKASKLRPARTAAREWAPVWQGDTETQATLIHGSLEAAGLRARIVGARGYPVGFGAMQSGTWTVFCRDDDAPRARRLLQERGEPGVAAGAPAGVSPEWRTTLILGAVLAGGALLVGLYAELLK
jgi:hypothetical protein